jgi:outer membrane protein OmpA-like peptidoglycan-associated protein
MRITLLFLLFAVYCSAQSDTTIRFYFDFASWELKGKDPFAQLDTNRWEPVLKLEARTDTTGSYGYNRALAYFRLQTVKKLLQQHPYYSVAHAKVTGEDYTVERGYRPQNERCVTVRLYAKIPGRAIAIDDRSKRMVGKTPEPVPPVEKNIALSPEYKHMPRTFHPDSALAPGDVVILRNIEFLINETVVTLESYPELQQLAKVMKEHPTMRIHIRGHVCCAPAQSLSDQRALKVYTYLVSNGIEPERMTYKGYSNKVPNPEAKQNLFDQVHRRVEIEVVKE